MTDSFDREADRSAESTRPLLSPAAFAASDRAGSAGTLQALETSADAVATEGSNASVERRRAWPGILSLIIATASGVAVAVAIALATGGEYTVSSLIGYAAVAATAVSFVLGVVAVAFARGRWWGLAGAMLSLAANPFVSVAVLGALG